jgi:hypothetical protein
MTLDFQSGVKRGAVISDDGKYRYRLWREWDPTLPTCCFVMLNPSTADANMDDPTIRRCMAFARREGCGRLEVVNLFAWRATDPQELRALNDFDKACGPDHEKHLGDATLKAKIIVAAWGACASFGKRGSALQAAMGQARDHGLPIFCLGKTKDGYPKHPLYLASDTPLEPYP